MSGDNGLGPVKDKYQVRRLGADDASAYGAFRQAQLAAFPTAFTSSAEEERLVPVSAISKRLATAGSSGFILGAFDPRGRLVGTAGLRRPRQSQLRHKATLFGMSVAADRLRRGIGRLLLHRLLQEANLEHGLLQIRLTVSEGNEPATALYRAFGFRLFGQEPRAAMVQGEPVTKLHMMLCLDRFE